MVRGHPAWLEDKRSVMRACTAARWFTLTHKRGINVGNQTAYLMVTQSKQEIADGAAIAVRSNLLGKRKGSGRQK